MKILGNFYERKTLEKLNNHIDCIIHCAAIRGETGQSQSEYDCINVAGTEELLKFAQEENIPRFIFISTVGVLGTIPRSQPASYLDPPAPDSKYHHSKWLAEQLVRNYHNENLRTIILRPTITYGTGDDGFTDKLIYMVKKNRFILPKSDILIHLLSIEGFSNLLIDILSRDIFNGNSYIIADREPVSLKKLVNLISLHHNNRNYPVYLAWPAGIFYVAKLFFRIFNSKQYLTSLKLISENWRYDIEQTITDLNYVPSSTINEIPKYLESINPK